MDNKSAIILIGPPGSGKSYLGQTIGEKLEFCHIDTGEIIKRIIFDPVNDSDAVIKQEKEKYLSGKLNSDEWVAKLILNEVKKISDIGKSIVFSGSPRRILEAEMLTSFLLKKYGKENIYVFLLNIDEKTARERMAKRRVCSKCGISLLPEEKIEKCSICSGEIIAKILDDPKKIKIRFQEYEERTKPIIDYFKNFGIVKEIDAEPRPEEIFESIIKHLKLKFFKQ